VARHLRTYLREQIQVIWSKDARAVREMQQARASEPPTIAILKRISDSARHDKPIDDAPGCLNALRQIGSELAKADFRIMVYDSRDDYVANEVVRGYVASGAAKPGRLSPGPFFPPWMISTQKISTPTNRIKT
jgi:hypothetical protein